MYFVMSDGPCWENKYYIADLESFPFVSPIRVCTSVFKFTWSQTPGWSGLCWWGFLQTGQIRARQRLKEDANKKCGNIHRDSYSTESACRRGVNAPACLVAEQWTVQCCQIGRVPGSFEFDCAGKYWLGRVDKIWTGFWSVWRFSKHINCIG